MKQFNVAEDIVPIGKFKVHASNYFRNLKETGRPMVITQNGKAAGVLISPQDFDELVYRKSFVDSVNKGLEDIKNGRTLTTEELKEKLAQRRK